MADAGASASAEPLVRFFVNGVRVAQGALAYPRPSPAPVGVVFAGSDASATSSIASVTSIDEVSSSSANVGWAAGRSVYNWQLGNVYIMEDSLAYVSIFFHNYVTFSFLLSFSFSIYINYQTTTAILAFFSYINFFPSSNADLFFYTSPPIFDFAAIWMCFCCIVWDRRIRAACTLT